MQGYAALLRDDDDNFRNELFRNERVNRLLLLGISSGPSDVGESSFS